MSIDILNQIIHDVRGPSRIMQIDAGTRLVDDLGLRSIELIALIARCEKAFGVHLVARSDLLARVSTAGDVLHLIDELRGSRAGA